MKANHSERAGSRVHAVAVWPMLAWASIAAVLGAAPAAADDIAGFAVTTPVRQFFHRIQEDWQDWRRAYYQDDADDAASALRDLMQVTAQLGMQRQPELASAAAVYAMRAAEDGNFARAQLALDAAALLDSSRPERHFAAASVRRREGDYLGAAWSFVLGHAKTLLLPDARILWLHNLLRWGLYVLVLSGGLFVAVQMAAKGGDLLHDLGRLVPAEVPRPVAALASVLLALWPLLLPSGLLWLLCWWALLLWGYGAASERVMLSLILLMVGTAPLVMRAEQRAIQMALSPPARAITALRDGRFYGGLLRDLGVLRSLLPELPAVVELEADLHRRLGQWEQARARYHEQLEQDPANAAVLNNLGVYAFRKQDFGGAIGYFERAAEADPQLAEAFYNLNLAYAQSYAFADSRQALARAREVDRAKIDAWVGADQSGTQVIPIEGSARRYGEIRAALSATWGGADPPPRTPRDLLRGNLSLSVALALILLAGGVHLVRRPYAYCDLYTDSEDDEDTFGQLRRAFIPGYPSARQGRGGRGFGGIALVVAVVMLPLVRALGFRGPLALDGGITPLVAVSVAALLLIILLRIGREFTAD